MLVLTRKTNEVIEIAPNITITVVQIKSNVVRLGIDAPKDIKIMRKELVNKELVNKELVNKEPNGN